MEFKLHFLYGFVISYILVYFSDFSILAGTIIFISSWMIDIDHYFWYSLEMKDYNPLHAIKWYRASIPKWFALPKKEREKLRGGVFIFHGILFWIILAALSFLHPIFLWVLIGVGIHMIADLIDLHFKGEPLYNKIFPLYVMKRNKNKKGLEEL